MTKVLDRVDKCRLIDGSSISPPYDDEGRMVTHAGTATRSRIGNVTVTVAPPPVLFSMPSLPP